MKPLYVQTRRHPEPLKEIPIWKRSPPWNVWLVEESVYDRLTLRLRCQGYTIGDGRKLTLEWLRNKDP